MQENAMMKLWQKNEVSGMLDLERSVMNQRTIIENSDKQLLELRTMLATTNNFYIDEIRKLVGIIEKMKLKLNKQLKGFKETDFTEMQRARLEEAIEEIANINAHITGNSLDGKGKEGRKSVVLTEEMMSQL